MRWFLSALALALAVATPKVHAAPWKDIAPPVQPRRGGTLTTLADGRILLVGGISGSVTVLAAEIFDPVTTTWKSAAPLIEGRAQHGAVRLPDGRVLVAGGVTAAGVPVTSAELFDPTTEKWTKAGGMAKPHASPLALGSDGVVAVVGGEGAGVELYKPSTNTWTTVMSTSISYESHALAAVKGGYLVVGGSGLSTSEQYDTATDTWHVLGGLDPRSLPSAVSLTDGRALVVGGGVSGFGQSATFNPESRDYTFVASRRRGAGVALAVMADGTVLAVGSAMADEKPPSIEQFDPKTNIMREVSPLSVTVNYALAASIDARSALILGASPPVAAVFTLPQTCTAASGCASGFCVDGYCCDSACTGQCEACDVSGYSGTCTGVNGAPHGKRTGCSPPWTPACRATTCDGGRDRNACSEPVFKPACDCSTDADCPGGSCADGVCCNTACKGQCEACDLPGSRGTCVPVTGEPRGIRKGCPVPGPGICTVQACDGKKTDGCTFINDATVNCDSICGGRVSRHCDSEGRCGLPHELKCPDNSCSTASPEPTVRPRLWDALFVLAAAAVVRRAKRRAPASRGAPPPSSRPLDR